MCALLGARRERLLLGPGLCWEAPLPAEGEALETKRLKTDDEKQRKQRGKSPREREMDG